MREASGLRRVYRRFGRGALWLWVNRATQAENQRQELEGVGNL